MNTKEETEALSREGQVFGFPELRESHIRSHSHKEEEEGKRGGNAEIVARKTHTYTHTKVC